MFLVCDRHVLLVISTALQKVRKPEKVIHNIKVCIVYCGSAAPESMLASPLAKLLQPYVGILEAIVVLVDSKH